jgi:RNase H-like domain found in reverse transcriptase
VCSILAWPDCAKPFNVYTDGSSRGVGGVMAQEQDGEVHPVAYASRWLSESERRLLYLWSLTNLLASTA